MNHTRLSLAAVTFTVAALLLAEPVVAADVEKSFQNNAASSPQSKKLSEAFDVYMQAAVRNAAFSGTVLVAKDGVAIYRKSYGLANRAFDVPNTDDTLYQLASVTKPFTATLIMILQAEGKLSVDDQACKYLADCPEAWRSITIRQLLAHTSGIPNYTSLPDWDEGLDSRTYGTGGLVALVRNLPLEFAPGTGFRYSNSGYNLLGTIIERVSGKSFPDVLRERILMPLRMTHTVFNASRTVVPHLATGYYSLGSTFIDATPQSMTGVYGEAGLSSTVDDLLIWTRALDTNVLISSAAYAQMIEPAKNNYGFGWEIKTWHKRQMIGHAGSGPGFSNMVARFPNDHLTVIVLSNSDEASGSGTAKALAGIYFGETAALPGLPPKTLILDAIQTGGAEAGIRRYQELKAVQPVAETYTNDELIVEIGYELYGLPAMDSARRIFEFALQEFPKSAYSHDGLADIAVAEGDVERAVSHFEMSLKLYPENQYAIGGLKRLRGN